MNYDQLYRQIRLRPHGWRWFGPYWFNVKMALRERGYTDLGDHDDPELRRIMAKTCKTELGLMRKAKRCYEENFGTYQDGNVQDFDLLS